MRLVSFTRDGERRVGGRANGGIVDLNAVADDVPPDMLALLAGGDATLAAARQALADGESRPDAQAPADARLLPAVPHPPKIICIARNYAEHAAEANLELLEYPNIFIRYPRSLLADGDPIQVPTVSHEVDWEAELAVIIGKEGKHIPRERALEHVAGYTVINDVSARTMEWGTPGREASEWDLFFDWLNGKWPDGFAPTGPWLVTADEIPDPQVLHMTLTVNGTRHQDASTADMLFSVAELIAFSSRFMTLEPGDTYATGTPSGVGDASGIYLKDGDVMEATIDGIGTLVTPVGTGAAVPA